MRHEPPTSPGFQLVPGHSADFLTISTHARARHFTDPAVVTLVLLQFLQAAASEGFAVIAYCFMPDHVHLVVVGRSATSELPRFVKLAKQRSGFYLQARIRPAALAGELL